MASAHGEDWGAEGETHEADRRRRNTAYAAELSRQRDEDRERRKAAKISEVEYERYKEREMLQQSQEEERRQQSPKRRAPRPPKESIEPQRPPMPAQTPPQRPRTTGETPGSGMIDDNDEGWAGSSQVRAEPQSGWANRPPSRGQRRLAMAQETDRTAGMLLGESGRMREVVPDDAARGRIHALESRLQTNEKASRLLLDEAVRQQQENEARFRHMEQRRHDDESVRHQLEEDLKESRRAQAELLGQVQQLHQIVRRDDDTMAQLVEKIRRMDSESAEGAAERRWRSQQEEGELSRMALELRARDERDEAFREESARRQSVLVEEVRRLRSGLETVQMDAAAAQQTMQRRVAEAERMAQAGRQFVLQKQEEERHAGGGEGAMSLGEYRQSNDAHVQQMEAALDQLTEDTRTAIHKADDANSEARQIATTIRSALTNQLESLAQHTESGLADSSARLDREQMERIRLAEELRTTLEMQSKTWTERAQQERSAIHSRFMAMEKSLGELVRDMQGEVAKNRAEFDAKTRALESRLMEECTVRSEGDKQLVVQIEEVSHTAEEDTRRVRDEAEHRRTDLEEVVRHEIRARMNEESDIRSSIEAVRGEISSRGEVLSAQMQQLEAQDKAAHELLQRAVKEDVRIVQEENQRAMADMDTVIQQLRQRLRASDQTRVKELEEIRSELDRQVRALDSSVDTLRTHAAEQLGRGENHRRELQARTEQLDERLQTLRAESEARIDAESANRMQTDSSLRKDIRSKAAEESMAQLSERHRDETRKLEARIRELEGGSLVGQQALALLRAETEARIQAEARARIDVALSVRRDLVRLEAQGRLLAEQQEEKAEFRREMEQLLPALAGVDDVVVKEDGMEIEAPPTGVDAMALGSVEDGMDVLDDGVKPLVEEGQMVEEGAAVEEGAPVDDGVTPLDSDVKPLADEDKTVEESSPVDDGVTPLDSDVKPLADEDKTVEEGAAVEEGAPVEESSPVDDGVTPLDSDVNPLADEDKNVEEGAAVEEGAPVEESSPVDDGVTPLDSDDCVKPLVDDNASDDLITPMAGPPPPGPPEHPDDVPLVDDAPQWIVTEATDAERTLNGSPVAEMEGIPEIPDNPEISNPVTFDDEDAAEAVKKDIPLFEDEEEHRGSAMSVDIPQPTPLGSASPVSDNTLPTDEEEEAGSGMIVPVPSPTPVDVGDEPESGFVAPIKPADDEEISGSGVEEAAKPDDNLPIKPADDEEISGSGVEEAAKPDGDLAPPIKPADDEEMPASGVEEAAKPDDTRNDLVKPVDEEDDDAALLAETDAILKQETPPETPKKVKKVVKKVVRKVPKGSTTTTADGEAPPPETRTIIGEDGKKKKVIVRRVVRKVKKKKDETPEA